MTIQINIKSIDNVTLQLYYNFITKLLKNLKNKNFKIQNLKKKRKKISLLKSPHVNKKSFEQFEICISKIIFCIKNIKSLNIIKFIFINKPVNVTIKIKTKRE